MLSLFFAVEDCMDDDDDDGDGNRKRQRPVELNTSETPLSKRRKSEKTNGFKTPERKSSSPRQCPDAPRKKRMTPFLGTPHPIPFPDLEENENGNRGPKSA